MPTLYIQFIHVDYNITILSPHNYVVLAVYVLWTVEEMNLVEEFFEDSPYLCKYEKVQCSSRKDQHVE